MNSVFSPAPLIGTENSLFKAIGEIFHPIFVAVANVLAFIYGIVPNYAIAITVLTILIMAVLTPLTVKSTRSMIATQALQPEMQKLRQKYKGAENREQLNQEMMRLYREAGVSPVGGCLPMLLQMPFLIVLYDILRGLSNTIVVHGHKVASPDYIPKSSLMYQHLHASGGAMWSFGVNLALTPFSHHAHWYEYLPYFGFVAAAVILQYVQMAQMTKRNAANAQNNPQMKQMQTMQRIMPLVFAFIYLKIQVGVMVYMVISSLVRIITQDIIFRFGLVKPAGQREIGAGAKQKQTRPSWFERLSTAAGGSSLVNGENSGRAGTEGNGRASGAGASGERPSLPREDATRGGGQRLGNAGTPKGGAGTSKGAGSPPPATSARAVAQSHSGGGGGKQRVQNRSKAKKARKAR